jgi:hypothetical protein
MNASGLRVEPEGKQKGQKGQKRQNISLFLPFLPFLLPPYQAPQNGF